MVKCHPLRQEVSKLELFYYLIQVEIDITIELFF